MTLRDAHVGHEYVVKELNLEQAIKRRLEALGLIHGTKVQKLNQNRNGAVVFKVRGTRLAIGDKIAASIFVEEVA